MQFGFKEDEREKAWKQFTYLKNYLLPRRWSFRHIRNSLLAREPSLEARLPELHQRPEKGCADFFMR